MGVSPSVGIDLKWFRIALVYNQIFAKSDVTVSQVVNANGISQSVNTTQSFSNSYLGIKGAFIIGGKAKRK